MKSLKVERTFSKGIAIAPAFVVNNLELKADNTEVKDASIEKDFFSKAVEAASLDLEVLAKQNDIFAAHIDLIQDPSLEESVFSFIDEGLNAESAVERAIKEIAEEFESIEDEYLMARAADMRDIGKRIMQKLKGVSDNPFENLKSHVIVVASDLTPSDTANMDFNLVDGFITEKGGVTSHVCIIARSLNIPAIVGAEGIMDAVKDGDVIAFDALLGEIEISPDEATLESYKLRKDEFEQQEKLLLERASGKSVTKDGKEILVCANVGSIEDIENSLKYNPDGVGLFRTEFLYMHSSDFPTEDEQFAVYKKAAELLDGKELIIRTLDIGGDKGLPYFDFGNELNPFLGYRAIRICLDKPEVFRAQMRALLRASAFGNIKIMYPMIASEKELLSANAIAKKCMSELDDEGIAYNKDIKIGMMMETPAATIMADVFAKHVDFFSIGTNDLTQYTLAVDRGNEKISYLYDSFEPSVLRSIKRIIDCGHKEGIPVGMCGEFASDKNAFPILLGMGLDEFSMSASAIPEIKSAVCESSYELSSENAQMFNFV